MTLFRNRMFLEGIAIGGICGIIIGSVIAFTLGESSMEAARSVMNKLFSVSRPVPFEYLSQ
jgi:ABC-type nitrate/sulfonate/bicarbonate transport system permease component